MKTFKSFGAFAAHLRVLAAESQALTTAAGEQAGEIVEERAKAKIGHYQSSDGRFSEWAPLKPATEWRKAAMDYPINSPLLGSGEMRDSIKHAVKERLFGVTVLIGSSDEKLIYHEFGTPKMPPRPVLGPALFETKEEIERKASRTLLAFLVGRKWKKR